MTQGPMRIISLFLFGVAANLMATPIAFPSYFKLHVRWLRS
ncbi:putative membrane protein [Yersinia pestis PY-66]|uniref:Uncharacterized protein n=3 Tax=Yersinia pseudotuberculosis complex TaxID=1649845 RepID=A0A0U1R013_YERP3|nr:hypothetical protein YpsIP31758_4067 [Yersinia pseudotuberculosis IP 31758]ABX86508.1 hypothetical protein YpAngola_A4064 [Yersinia pestis Angola]EDR33735.1 hypothetical protein YPIP275_4557 [Yersinia pestis biovar Orientalis str. IP275]EDR38312.1 hypothetical protein YpF1991016_4445 [Yersinia pestis biovar Orientalis str. F1991016]EDR43877.1 hypothetical protein YpE1979001_3783 [Yersinia pestis biovar Antiqua str. E1979001]EDR49881.1 hypothetical protein YpB42003004_2853 [Yersinia pestis b